MKRRMTLSLAFAGAMVLLLVGSAPAEVIVNTAEPFERVVFVPCADGGAGEEVLLTGFLHVLITETTDANGVAHFMSHFQPMGIVGTGLTTDDMYRGTGVEKETTNNASPPPSEDTFVSNFRIIGQGPGNNFLLHQLFHVTVNANGEVTVEVDNLSVDCK
jgi:hypothetical protein